MLEMSGAGAAMRRLDVPESARPRAVANPAIITRSFTARASQRPLPIDKVMSDWRVVGRDLAENWVAWMRRPRARLWKEPDPTLAAQLVLWHEPNGGRTDAPAAKQEDRRPMRDCSAFRVEAGSRRLVEVRLGVGDAERLLAAGSGFAAAAQLQCLPVWERPAGSLLLTSAPWASVLARHLHEAMVLLRLAASGGALTAHGLAPPPRGVDAPYAGWRWIEAALRERELAVLRPVYKAFVGCLDPIAVGHCGPYGCVPTFAFYDWLRAATAERRTRRSQAARSYPFLVSLAASGQAGGEAAEQVSAAVDAGQALVPVLARALGVSQKFVRRWPALDGLLPRREICRLPALLRWLALAPAQRLPATGEEWRAFVALSRQLSCLCEYWPAARHIRDKALRGFLARAASAGWCSAWSRFQAHNGPTRGFQDLDDFARQGGWFFGKERFAAIADRLLHNGVEAVQAASVQWHRALHDGPPPEGDAHDPVDQSWPALIKPNRLGGLALVSLCSTRALEWEGRSLRHCVGSYSRRCLFERTHVLSLRDSNGPCSTVEVELRETPAGWRADVVQHCGLENGTPSAACQQAVRELKDWLRRPGTIDFDGLEVARLARCHEREEREQAMRAFGNRAAAYALRAALPADCFPSPEAGENQ